MKKKVLLSSIATIALCLCLIAGSTFALFTSTDEVNIAVTAGKVEMVAGVAITKVESVLPNENGTIVDEFGGKYGYDYIDAAAPYQFENGGTAEINGNILTLDRMTPGDKVTFEVSGTNNSDVTIQYRYKVECNGDELLMSGLVVTVEDTAYPVLDSYTSVWTALPPSQNVTETVVIELPVTAGNEYQRQSTDIKITVEAVQGNADIGENNVEVKFLSGYNATLVSDLASLQAALDNTVEGDNIIVLDGDITGDAVVTQKANVNTIIEGNGHTYAGTITVDGKSATIMTAGLTIRNVNFSTDALTAGVDACIRLGDGTNATRYVCNLTVEGCTFDVPDMVGIKSYTGGDKNVSILNCTATARAHSIAQLKGVDGVLVQNCTVKSIRGINFNNSDNVVVDDCDFDVQKYAIRFGESANTTVETYTIIDCNIKSQNVDDDAAVVLRAGATNANLTVTGTTIDAQDPGIDLANYN